MAAIQITAFPTQIGVEAYFSIGGTADGLAGKPLTLVIDNLYQMGAGIVPTNGNWSVRFRFTSPGNRSLVFLGQDDRGNMIRSQSIAITVVNTPPPPLQVTAFPHQVKTEEFLTVNGIAKGLDGKPLTLTIDNTYQMGAGDVPTGGNWSVRFRFTSPGDRQLVFSADAQGQTVSSPPVSVTVFDLPASIEITSVPPEVQVRQEFPIAGRASITGQPVILTIDNQFKTNIGLVAADGTWQALFQFLQPGVRRLTASIENGDNPIISETATVNVLAASPRLTITPPTQTIRAGEGFVLSGAAKFADGEQLVVRADRQYILARPIVQNERWQAALFFHQAGKRLIEVIASDQERAQLDLTVAESQSSLQVYPRTIWTSTPTPEGLPDLINPKRITLHHTVIANLSTGATQTQEIDRMRRILDIHLNSSGYADIGYHYIVMPSGRVYEGRSSRKRGAHDVVNDGIGVAVDGNFQGSLRLGEQQYDAVVTLATILCKRLEITDPVTPVNTITADFGTRSLPRILGHRDRVATACPGTVYQRLSEIRQAVKQGLT